MISHHKPKLGNQRRIGVTSLSFPDIPDAPVSKDSAIFFATGLIIAMTQGAPSNEKTANGLLGSLSMLFKLNNQFGNPLTVQDILFIMHNPSVGEKSRYLHMSRFFDDISKDRFDARTVTSFAGFFHSCIRSIWGVQGKDLVKKIYRQSLGINITSMIATAKRRDKRITKGMSKDLAKFAPVVSCALCDADLSSESEIKEKCLKICRLYERSN